MAYIYPVFHINLLELQYKPLLEKNFYLGPIKHPKVMGEWYKVKAILYYKSVKNKLQYKVKWLGQPAKDSIQEPADYLNNCKYLLKKILGLKSAIRKLQKVL